MSEKCLRTMCNWKKVGRKIIKCHSGSEKFYVNCEVSKIIRRRNDSIIYCNKNNASQMRGYPHHIQSPMGGSHDPKFPQNSDDYQHHHHHNGYVHNGAVGSNTLSMGNDYSNLYHQSNGIHTNASNYNYSDTGHFYQQNGSYSSQMHSTPNSGFQANNNGYYSAYYSSHQMMDFPIQCPNSEPTNTVLGLQELGRHQSCT